MSIAGSQRRGLSLTFLRIGMVRKMSDEDFEKQLREDFKAMVEHLMDKPDHDEVECIVCGGKTTFGRYKAFNRIATESGRFIGNIEGTIQEKRRILKLVDDKLKGCVGVGSGCDVCNELGELKKQIISNTPSPKDLKLEGDG